MIKGFMYLTKHAETDKKDFYGNYTVDKDNRDNTSEINLLFSCSTCYRLRYICLAIFHISYDVAIYFFGLLIFLETAGLFLAGGIADFTESYGSVNLRNFFGRKKTTYSREKHQKNEIIGAALVLAGVWFIFLAVLMFILHIQ